MNFTNKYNLPEEFIDWIKKDDYDYEYGVISATALLSPPRSWALRKNNWDRLEVDLTNIISSRFGTIVHESLAECIKIDESRGDFKEKRFYTVVNGQKISGKADLFVDHTVKDYKTTSVYKYLKQDYSDYIKQLSVNRYILIKNGYEVNEVGSIYFIFNDWNKKDIIKEGYPSARIVEVKMPLMSVEETENFIIKRLELFNNALTDLPLCSKEELWETESTFAVMKTLDAARALRVFPTKEEADAFNAENKNIVVERKGIVKRCEYCSVHPICEQCQQMISENRVANLTKDTI